MAERARITITGIVQGVGFRPYVYTLAAALGIRGHVTNTANGVLIEAEGERLAEFLDRLPKEAPPLSRISTVNVAYLPADGSASFKILPSTDTEKAFTLLSPDVSICPECLRELLDPRDRRHLYPFINCTNCGPRYTITLRVPYDRQNTTMAPFAMCPACAKEYHDPLNRRFHAQPNACPECGPQVEFRSAPHPGPLPGREREDLAVPLSMGERIKVRGDALKACIDLLREDGIVAIKGLGGFHIACDATSDSAVKRLRERKRKSNKPFALMAPSIEEMRTFCEVNEQEQSLLESRQRPIVLLRKKQGTAASILSEAVSPNNSYIGCMLPYTPLHYLLFHQKATTSDKPNFRALVMTSGNLSEEPIVRNNEEAVQKLSGIVDAFLLHNRDIFMRVDDTVLRVRSAEPSTRAQAEGSGVRKTSNSELRTLNPELMFLRRSRGYAPEPIPLDDDGPEVLGCGADIKNTFTLTKGAYAIPSQHIGDMENYETVKFYEEVLENLKQVYRVNPIAIAHDLHPVYLSTHWAKEHSAHQLFGIQHHYAHIGSVMAEHGLRGPVIGVAFDGTGYGTDGNLWGGEFLIAGIDDFKRFGQFKYIQLPGGEAAIREPWRTAAALVAESAGAHASELFDTIGFYARYGKQSIEQVLKIANIKEVSPLSSGAGRLFDAVSALIGLCDKNTFEGEAAMSLESLVQEDVDEKYPVVFHEANQYTIVDFGPTISAIIDDLIVARDHSLIATKFHNTVLFAVVTMVGNIRQSTGILDVALSGGTFQNKYLMKRSQALLAGDRMNVYVNQKMPPNDACISLGQAYLVRERLKKCGVASAECGI